MFSSLYIIKVNTWSNTLDERSKWESYKYNVILNASSEGCTEFSTKLNEYIKSNDTEWTDEDYKIVYTKASEILKAMILDSITDKKLADEVNECLKFKDGSATILYNSLFKFD